MARAFPFPKFAKTFATAAVLAAVFTFSLGCDSKKPTTGNFEDALQTYFDKHPACERLILSGFPMEVTLDRDGKPSGYGSDTELEDALVKAGLLKVSESTKHTPGNMYMPATTERIRTYAMTPGHDEVWAADESGRRGGRLCYGQVKVTGVDNFTEPGDVFGRHVSEVDYTYKLTCVPSWAQDKSVRGHLPGLAAGHDEKEQKSKAMLELTHNGWQPADELRVQ